ncbi:hypothetical protein CTA2_5579 [Colletotrichum tanaceti]|uniref:N-acetyltransferase domain-containing protein n=1 Tax=Colletotrichum tanaceti TaxID=1306861 RepID=A0A4U6X1Y0_9PEZI|nr:hypothetical protein CTA2_5579 [Colletotrichum tanaceti]TKW49378.1 hypothetical protein CTA1_4012 [Colletotrichum tanaceti]
MNRQDNAQTAVSIVSATPDDMAELVKLHTAAFRSDLFSNLMLLNRPADTHQLLMLKSIDHWFGDVNTHLIKAVAADGQMVGWACWALKGVDGYQAGNSDRGDTSPAANPEATNPNQEGPVTEDPSEMAAAVRGKRPETSSGGRVLSGQSMTQDPARRLGGLMREETVRREHEYLDGKKYVALQALATDPSRRGCGIGSRLIQWVVDKADVNGLPCWAHASPAGNSLYARAGFQQLDKTDFNLAEWAPGGREGNRGWGTYTFRYMLRPAKALVI